MTENWITTLRSKLRATDAGCWEFTGSTNGNGYGRMIIDGRRRYTHRLMAHYALGMPLDSRQVVCHSCDNPPCCNPDHLFIGTQADNVRDMMTKGRREYRPTHPTTRPCDHCGIEYEPNPDHRGRSKVCSPACRGALYGSQTRGTCRVLDADQLADVARALVAGESQSSIAARYGVSQMTVSNIKRGKR